MLAPSLVERLVGGRLKPALQNDVVLVLQRSHHPCEIGIMSVSFNAALYIALAIRTEVEYTGQLGGHWAFRWFRLVVLLHYCTILSMQAVSIFRPVRGQAKSLRPINSSTGRLFSSASGTKRSVGVKTEIHSRKY